MHTPFFARPLTADERATWETGLRSASACTVRRCHILLVRACQLDTNIHLGRITAHNAVHRCEVAEMLQASPQDFRTGVVAPTAPHKPAELGDPGNCLAQRRRLSRWRRDPMDGTI